MSPSRVKLLALFVVLLALTVGVGVSAYRHVHRVISDPITRPAPELGGHPHVLLPNLRGAVQVVPDRPHDPSEMQSTSRFQKIQRRRRFTVSTNSHGMRGPEFADVPGGQRVLCLGDSVTFGWGVEQPESYPALLAQQLGVEVLNAGVPAMKPDTIAAWASRYAAPLHADLVVFTRRPDWMGGGPDPIASYAAAVAKVQRAVAPAPVVVVLPPVSTFDIKGSQQWEWEYQQVRARLGAVPVLELTPVFRQAQRGRPGIILQLDGTVQRVIQQPSGDELVRVDAPDGRLSEPVIRLFEDDGLSEPLFFDGGHPDREGYALFAGTVAGWLRERGLPR